MKILFLAPYPPKKSPSQRFRFEHYLPSLENEGIYYEYHSFLDDGTWEIIYKSGNFIRKLLGILKGFCLRIALMFTINKFDYVYIHREVTPLGPPIFEWIITKIFRKKTIYDFDDAIWIPNTSKANFFAKWFKYHHKVGKICSWVNTVSVGNDFLAAYASKFNQQVVVIPTVVDTENYHNKIQNQDVEQVNIGWTGSHSTLKYIDEIVTVLKKLEQEFSFSFYVIANKKPKINLKSLKFIKWHKGTEIDDLLKFHIGIMPMYQDDWTEGKCGFKAIQYMALGIPTVVSPVGVNKDIVEDGVSGFLCKSREEWEEKLRILLKNNLLRQQLGKSARTKIVDTYSVESTGQVFKKLFR